MYQKQKVMTEINSAVYNSITCEWIKFSQKAELIRLY